MNSRPCVTRTISFDSTDEKDRAPSTSEHSRRRSEERNAPSVEGKRSDGSRKKSHNDGKTSPKRPRPQRPPKSGDVDDTEDIVSREHKHHRSKHSSSKPKRSGSNPEKRSKRHGEKHKSKSKRSLGSGKRHPNQDSVSGSTFTESFVAEETIASTMSTRENDLSRSGTLLAESIRTGFDVDGPNRAYATSARKPSGEISVGSASISMEGLSDEQRIWAGIARVLDNYSDNGSVETRDVLSPSIMKALADSYSTFNSAALPTGTMDQSGRTSRFSSALSIAEESEQNFDGVPVATLYGAPVRPAPAATIPSLMNSSFSSLISDLQSHLGSVGKPTVDQNTNQEDALLAFIDSMAAMVKSGQVPPTVAANGNKDMFNLFSWAKQKVSEANDDKEKATPLPEKESRKGPDNEGLVKQESRRQKKTGRSTRPRSSPSHNPNRKKHDESKKDQSRRRTPQRSHRNESRKSPKEESGDNRRSHPATTTEESLHSQRTDPLEVSDSETQLQLSNQSLTMDNLVAPAGLLSIDRYSAEPAQEKSNFQSSIASSLTEMDYEGDESYDKFEGPKRAAFTSPQQLDMALARPAYNVHDDGNNSMPSLSTYHETEMRVADEELMDKLLSYGDLGYEEANDGAALSPVPARRYPNNAMAVLSPEAARTDDIQERFTSSSGSLMSPFRYMKKKTKRPKKLVKKKLKKKKKSPANSTTASTESTPGESLSTPEDFRGFFEPEDDNEVPSPCKSSPFKARTTIMPRMPGLHALLTPRKPRSKDPVENTPLSQLRKGVMKLPFFGRKKRSPDVIDTGRRDAQFYPDQEESDHGFGSLLD